MYLQGQPLMVCGKLSKLKICETLEINTYIQNRSMPLSRLTHKVSVISQHAPIYNVWKMSEY